MARKVGLRLEMGTAGFRDHCNWLDASNVASSMIQFFKSYI